MEGKLYGGMPTKKKTLNFARYRPTDNLTCVPLCTYHHAGLAFQTVHLHCYPTVCLLLREIATQSRQIMSSEALLLNGFGQNPQKPTSMTLSIRSACASGSRRTQWLQMILTRVVPATASYSARGIGSQASVGAAVDEELRQAGKTCCRHRASGFQASCRL